MKSFLSKNWHKLAGAALGAVAILTLPLSPAVSIAVAAVGGALAGHAVGTWKQVVADVVDAVDGD